MEELFNLTGSLICHQLPARTLYAGNMLLPVCARDMGIYTGIFTGALFLLLFRRLNTQKPPGITVTVLMCVLMLPMILDGLLSYTGVIETNNTTRLFTGVFFGLPIPFFLVPAAHFKIHGTNERRVLKNSAELFLVYTAAVGICLLLWYGLLPYVITGLIFVSGFLFLLSRLTYTIFVRQGRFGQKVLYTATCCTTLSILILLFLISTYILQPLKIMLLGG